MRRASSESGKVAQSYRIEIAGDHCGVRETFYRFPLALDLVCFPKIIGVEEGNPFLRCRTDARISRRRDVPRTYLSNRRSQCLRDAFSLIRTVVGYDDQFRHRERLSVNTFDSLLDKSLGVMSGNLN